MESWEYKDTLHGINGHIGSLYHKSYNVVITIYKNCFYITGNDSFMIAVNSHLLELIQQARNNNQ